WVAGVEKRKANPVPMHYFRRLRRQPPRNPRDESLNVLGRPGTLKALVLIGSGSELYDNGARASQEVRVAAANRLSRRGVEWPGAGAAPVFGTADFVQALLLCTSPCTIP